MILHPKVLHIFPSKFICRFIVFPYFGELHYRKYVSFLIFIIGVIMNHILHEIHKTVHNISVNKKWWKSLPRTQIIILMNWHFLCLEIHFNDMLFLMVSKPLWLFSQWLTWCNLVGVFLSDWEHYTLQSICYSTTKMKMCTFKDPSVVN